MRLSAVAVPVALTLLGGAIAGCASAPPSGTTTQDRVRVQAGDLARSKSLDVTMHNRAESVDASVPLTAVAAFDALPNVYRRLGIATVAVVDTAGGVYTVGVRNLRVHGSIGGTQLSTYLDCGSAPMHAPANSYDVVLNATSYVTPSGEGSTVHTLVTAYARDPLANTPPVECSSTGRFETSVADMLAHLQPQG